MSPTPASGPAVQAETGALRWLLLAAVPVFLLFLNANAIWDANEAFYVETPRQMVLTGDYVVPTFNDAPRLNKPVLSYWVVAALYRAFGVYVSVERLGIALGGLGIILATFVIGRAVGSRRTGLLAALVVASAPQVVFWSRRIFIDVYLTLFTSLALAAFVSAERDPARRRRWLLGMYLAIGCGVLTKGPVALALPVLVIGVWLAAERRLADVRRLALVSGAAIVATVVVPWYVALVARLGWAPVTEFLLGENIGRFASAMAPGDRGVFFYLPVLLTDLFPWAPLVLVPLVTAAPWRLRDTGGAAGLRRLLWWWTVLIVIAFSVSQTKQALYIFPVVPAVAALVADALVRSDWGVASRGLRILVPVVGVTTVALAVAVYVVLGPSRGVWSLAGADWAAVSLGLGGVASAVLWIRGRPAGAIASLAAGLVLFNYVLVGRILPDVERFKPTPAIAAVLGDRASPDARVAQWGMSLPSLVYYARRSVEAAGSLDDAAEWLAADRETWILVSEVDGRALAARVPSVCIALRAWSSTLQIGDVLARKEPPAIVLVTNKCS